MLDLINSYEELTATKWTEVKEQSDSTRNLLFDYVRSAALILLDSHDLLN